MPLNFEWMSLQKEKPSVRQTLKRKHLCKDWNMQRKSLFGFTGRRENIKFLCVWAKISSLSFSSVTLKSTGYTSWLTNTEPQLFHYTAMLNNVQNRRHLYKREALNNIRNVWVPGSGGFSGQSDCCLKTHQESVRQRRRWWRGLRLRGGHRGLWLWNLRRADVQVRAAEYKQRNMDADVVERDSLVWL